MPIVLVRKLNELRNMLGMREHGCLRRRSRADKRRQHSYVNDTTRRARRAWRLKRMYYEWCSMGAKLPLPRTVYWAKFVVALTQINDPQDVMHCFDEDRKKIIESWISEQYL